MRPPPERNKKQCRDTGCDVPPSIISCSDISGRVPHATGNRKLGKGHQPLPAVSSMRLSVKEQDSAFVVRQLHLVFKTDVQTCTMVIALSALCIEQAHAARLIKSWLIHSATAHTGRAAAQNSGKMNILHLLFLLLQHDVCLNTLTDNSAFYLLHYIIGDIMPWPHRARSMMLSFSLCSSAAAARCVCEHHN